MTAHLDRMESVADDLGDALSIAQRALERVHRELSDARARALGQAELPLGGGQGQGAHVPGPAPTRGALLGYLDDLEDAVERGDAESAIRGLRNLRSAIETL